MRRAFFVCRITITSNFSEFANLETTCASLLERRVHRSSDRAAQPRRGFFENAHVLCALQAKHNEPVAMLMFDLDHFKSINDRFDHTTQAMKSCVCSAGWCGRGRTPTTSSLASAAKNSSRSCRVVLRAQARSLNTCARASRRWRDRRLARDRCHGQYRRRGFARAGHDNRWPDRADGRSPLSRQAPCSEPGPHRGRG